MTRPSDKHLDEVELDALVSGAKAQLPDVDWLTNSSLKDVEQHVESCRDCRLKVQMHRSVQNEMSRLRVREDIQRGPDCFEETEWLQVAAGVLPETKTKELMKHASQCGHCGPLLKEAIETLSNEVTPKEEQMLASLESMGSRWQAGMARTLRDGSRERTSYNDARLTRGWFFWPRQAFAVAGLAVVIAVAWLGFQILHPSSAERLLAHAYTEHRTLEVRISGAKFAPLRAERGQGESNLDRPSSLLRAEALISENLDKNPNDPVWLRAKAQADLLDRNYESAIKSLELALESQPNSPPMLTDLASAYFERAEATNRPVDYGNAMEYLGKALNQTPDDPVALFNRAVIAERLYLYAQAVDDWEHYLRVDPSGDWADDARKHLAWVKEKLEQHQQGLNDPMLEPREIAKGAEDAALRAKIDRRIEEYLHRAVTTWLPQAFPTRSTEPSSIREARTALAVLGVTESLHADPWLTDLLKGSHAALFTTAVQALASAVESDDRGDYLAARNSATRAARLFQLLGNLPGELRAKAEEVYADHLLYDGHQCMKVVGKITRPIELHRYAWLEAEVTLEESNCAALVGELGRSKRLIVQGMQEARSHNYLALYLRVLGFQADAYANQGNPTTAFLLGTEGLGIFWSNQVDIMKGYNLYTDLDTAADDLKLANLQVALWKQATAVID